MTSVQPFHGERVFSNIMQFMVDSRSWCKMSWVHQFLLADVYGRKGKPSACLEMHLLMPIKTLAYGVPMHNFLYNFKMIEDLGRMACREFDAAIRQCYMDEFACHPTDADIKSIAKLHKSKHKFDGMFWLLDCSHTYWKNCPKAWHELFKGKENNPSIVLEAICDEHTFLASFLWIHGS